MPSMIGWFKFFIALLTELPYRFLNMSKAHVLMFLTPRPALSAVFPSQLMANSIYYFLKPSFNFHPNH